MNWTIGEHELEEGSIFKAEGESGIFECISVVDDATDYHDRPVEPYVRAYEVTKSRGELTRQRFRAIRLARVERVLDA